MAHAQKPDIVFRRNGRVHLNRRGRQFSRLLAAEVCASAVVMLDKPRSEGAWEYWLPTSFASFPFTSPLVRHRVPSGFIRTLRCGDATNLNTPTRFWNPNHRLVAWEYADKCSPPGSMCIDPDCGVTFVSRWGDAYITVCIVSGSECCECCMSTWANERVDTSAGRFPHHQNINGNVGLRLCLYSQMRNS